MAISVRPVQHNLINRQPAPVKEKPSFARRHPVAFKILASPLTLFGILGTMGAPAGGVPAADSTSTASKLADTTVHGLLAAFGKIDTKNVSGSVIKLINEPQASSGAIKPGLKKAGIVYGIVSAVASFGMALTNFPFGGLIAGALIKMSSLGAFAALGALNFIPFALIGVGLYLAVKPQSAKALIEFAKSEKKEALAYLLLQRKLEGKDISGALNLLDSETKPKIEKLIEAMQLVHEYKEALKRSSACLATIDLAKIAALQKEAAEIRRDAVTAGDLGKMIEQVKEEAARQALEFASGYKKLQDKTILDSEGYINHARLLIPLLEKNNPTIKFLKEIISEQEQVKEEALASEASKKAEALTALYKASKSSSGNVAVVTPEIIEIDSVLSFLPADSPHRSGLEEMRAELAKQTPAAKTPQAGALQPGEVRISGINRDYIRGEKIGEGGMGVVFKGKTNDGKLVVIKYIKIADIIRDEKKKLGEDEDGQTITENDIKVNVLSYLMRFLKEFELGGKGAHLNKASMLDSNIAKEVPNIETLKKIFQRDAAGQYTNTTEARQLALDGFDLQATAAKEIFIVSEFIPEEPGSEVKARNIRDYWPQGLPADNAVKYMLPALDALAAMHEQGVAHRDLKPENILVTLRNGQPAIILIDFGLAIDLTQERRTKLTQSNQVAGTLRYLPNEVYINLEKKNSAKSILRDIYSMGLILFELMGKDPFSGKKGAGEVYLATQAGDYAFDSIKDDAVRSVLRKMLAKDPADNFQSVREAMDALKAAIRVQNGDSGAKKTATLPRSGQDIPQVHPLFAAAEKAIRENDMNMLEKVYNDLLGADEPPSAEQIKAFRAFVRSEDSYLEIPTVLNILGYLAA